MKYRRRFFLCTGQVVAAEDAWRFTGSHILGDLRDMSLPSCIDSLAERTEEEGRVPALALWLTPVDCLRVPPLHPEIVAYILGEARLIRCRFEGCGRMQRWERGF